MERQKKQAKIQKPWLAGFPWQPVSSHSPLIGSDLRGSEASSSPFWVWIGVSFTVPQPREGHGEGGGGHQGP